MMRNLRTLFGPRGLNRAAFFALASIVAVVGALALTFSAFAAGPPIDGKTSPTDARCQRFPTENLFFLNMPTPSAGNPAPGDKIGAWYSDETGLNQGSADPASPFYLVFRLTGPGVNQELLADTTEIFNQSKLFTTKYKECKIQVNIKTVIPATVNGGAYPAGDYTVSLKAWDNDQTRLGGDHSIQTWHFSVAAAQPSPSPTAQVSPASSPSPATQVQAATTTGPSLPKAGSGPVSSSGPAAQIGTGLLLLAAVATLGVAITRTVRGRRLR
jgi:hypothetical protein